MPSPGKTIKKVFFMLKKSYLTWLHPDSLSIYCLSGMNPPDIGILGYLRERVGEQKEWNRMEEIIYFHIFELQRFTNVTVTVTSWWQLTTLFPIYVVYTDKRSLGVSLFQQVSWKQECLIHVLWWHSDYICTQLWRPPWWREEESPGPTRKVSILSLWLALQTLSLILRWAPHYLLLFFRHLMTQFQMLGFQSWFWDNFSIDGKNKPILTICLPLLCVIFVKLSHLFFSCLNSLLPQQLWGYIY